MEIVSAFQWSMSYQSTTENERETPKRANYAFKKQEWIPIKDKRSRWYMCIYTPGINASVCPCNWVTHTKSQMMQAPSELAVTHSLLSLLILMQVTVALCSFIVSSSRWPCGCNSQTRTYIKKQKENSYNFTGDPFHTICCSLIKMHFFCIISIQPK